MPGLEGDDRLPVTALIPDTPQQTITVFDEAAALRLGIAEREGTPHLGSEWDVPGVYVLLDPIHSDGSWGVYVGKAPTGMRTRLQQHIKSKDHWSRALLIARDTTNGFNSAHVGWLEGRLYELFLAARNASPHNKQKPGDETLPMYERLTLERAVVPITRVLRLIGYDSASLDQDIPTAKSSAKTRKTYAVTLKQLIDAGVLPAGPLVSANPNYNFTAELLADGTILFAGIVYQNASSSAAAARGLNAINGWDSWGVATAGGTRSLATYRAEWLQAQSTSPAEPAAGS